MCIVTDDTDNRKIDLMEHIRKAIADKATTPTDIVIYYVGKFLQRAIVKNYEVNYNKALGAMEIGKYKEPQKLLMSQEVRGMQNINAMNLLGVSLYEQKKERKIIKVWQQVLKSGKQKSKALQYIIKVDLLSPKERFLGLIER